MKKSLKSLLETIIPEAHRWKFEIFKQWPHIIGALKNNATIEKIENDVLYIGVTHPAWAQELQLLTPMLKKKINSYFSEIKINHLRFRYNVHAPTQAPASTPPPKTQELAHEQQSIYSSLPLLTEQDQAVLASLPTEELKSIMTAYLIRCKALKRSKDVNNVSTGKQP